jgi:acyl-CoA reductase-like NAD-dependent aldehyde dehydrogenase
MMPTKQLIDGKWVDAIDGGRWDVSIPRPNRSSPTCRSVAPDAMRAIDAAHRAFPDGARGRPTSAARSEGGGELMRARADQLGELTVRESGKPLAEAVREWQIAGDFFEWYAEEGKRIGGDVIASRVATKRMLVLKEPIGVVGVITAWNFPAYNPARAGAAALAAGCTSWCVPPS